MSSLGNIKGRMRDLAWKIRGATHSSFYHALENDLRIKLYYDSVLSYLIYYCEFEKAEQHFVNVFLREGDIFVDVGANVGLFSLIASRRVAEKGRVYAFEPAGKMFARLNENIELNNIGNTVPLKMALSNAIGEATLKVSLDGYDAWSSLGESLVGVSIVEERVSLVTLDSFCKEHDLMNGLTMVKIDVEGWEKNVLQGAEEVLSSDRAPLLLVEFAEDCAKNAGTSCQELYRQIADYGYTLYQYDLTGNRLIEEGSGKEYAYINLICAKSKMAKQRLSEITGSTV